MLTKNHLFLRTLRRSEICLLAVGLLLGSCGSTEQESSNSSGANEEGTNDGQDGGATTDGTANTNDTIDDEKIPQQEDDRPWVDDLDGMFVGYDGTNDFSVYIPGRIKEIGDSSLISMQEETFTPTEDVVNEVTALLEPLMEELGIPAALAPVVGQLVLAEGIPVTKVVPQKAGSTTMTVVAGVGVFTAEVPTELYVNAYTPTQIEQGQVYYVEKCASCHEGEQTGAPAHTLGQVLAASDDRMLELIKNNVPFTWNNELSYNHSFEFSSDDDGTGVVGYVRTLQTKELETLSLVLVEALKTYDIESLLDMLLP